ncbi:histamine H2 receptor-like [Montipora foliosa]|uniref:histamine H2 receptor-like n=1 Tax=Montipora foliosa TaxID=591990 RepID=UPI0035F1E592
MNSSSASANAASTVRGCDPAIPQGTLDHTTPEAYCWLVFITVVNIITCPLTTVLNALVIIAVATKHRLNTNTNIALACLSTTDLAMGVIGQPLSISKMIAELRGNTSGTYCVRTLLATIALRVLSSASLSHLTMMNVERYIAIKHALKYETIVTKYRLIYLSSLMWIAELSLTVPLSIVDDNLYFRVDNFVISCCIATIFFCQFLLYHETSRHKKQIASQQVSLEAREKFLKEKKASKLTATVLFFLILCYLPFIVARALVSNYVISSVNLAYIALFTARAAAVLNSLLNPIIFCVRIKQFRIAFIQLLFKKDHTEAENIEKRVFGRLNHEIPLQ